MPDRRIRLLAPCLTLLLLPLGVARAAERIDVDDPPDGLFSDEWAEVYLQGGKIGYAHATMQRQGGRIHSAIEMHLKIVRANVTLAITTEQRTTETVAGEPLAFETRMDMSNVPSSTKGTIRDGKVEIVTSQLGMEDRKSFDFPQDALMIWGTYRQSIKRGFAPDTRYTIPTYSPEVRLDGAVDMTYHVIGPDQFTHDGRDVRGVKVASSLDLPQMGKMETTSWVRPEDGVALKTTLNMAGMTMDVLACDQRTALADFVSPEFFMSNAVPAGRALTPGRIERIRYLLWLSDAKAELPEVVETGMQRVAARTADSVELVVARQDHTAIAGAAAGSASVGEEFLASNMVMKLDDPALVKLAKEAAGGAARPIELAGRLREFVTAYVDDKSLDVGFATASEVCRTRQGDCSEHAVLLAALGRINKLPARVAVGLAYVPRFGGQSDIFGFHMWTQFHINGQWVDFDAALRETEVSPARIVFATSSLHDTGLVELSFALMKVIGRVKLRILEVVDRP